MNTYGPIVTLTSGAAVGKNKLVKMSGGKAIVTTGGSGADATVVGVALEGAAAANQEIPVRLLNSGGIFGMVAALADLAADDLLYTAADGEVTDANTSGTVVGIALTASAAVNDVIDVIACDYVGS
jgi:hypothetical protein